MAMPRFLAALFGRGRRATVYSANVARAQVLGMGPTELYRRQPALRAVVSFLADNVAGVPLKCYVRAADDDRPRDTESDLAQLLQRPSPGMTEHELMRALVSDFLLYGAALLVVLPDRAAPSGWSMRHIPWSWITATSTDNGFEPSSYDITNPYTGGRVTFDANDCILFAQYDPSGPLGTSSPVEALREVLSEQVSAWNFRNAVWRNGGRVSQYLYRPKDAPDWVGNGGRDRFTRSWKAKFGGEDGTDTGGTPLLEDGMELRAVTFNAREAEWAEATRLTREDVAAVYHVNPSLIWHTEGQTYASAKDNARALYADTLSPIMDMVEERLNAFLVTKLGMDPSVHYVEFDLSAKLAASFEEQAGVLQSSAGGPWMTRNEVRARMNLPALEGGDELIVPLNVSEGGLAAPNDTDPTVERYNASPDPLAKAASVVRFQSKASPAAVRTVADVLRAFYGRQAESMANAISAMDVAGVPWDAKDRWVRELTSDLLDAARLPMTDAARDALRELGIDPDAFDATTLDRDLDQLCSVRADHIVQSTMERLEKMLGEMDGTQTPDELRASVHGLYERLMEGRVERNAESMATAIANAGTTRGAASVRPTCMKEWVAMGRNTRHSHASMNGERVPIDGRFSNGARWPGDTSLPAEETCNCRCRIEIVDGE